MSKPEISNPVTAIAEEDATGEVADIFADIRDSMEIPLITSIWRILVDIEDGLRASWDVTKPVYETGQPQAALLKIREQASLPIPEPLASSQLTCVGVSGDDLPSIRAILDAYNRSNGLNLIALTALVATPSGPPANDPPPRSPPSWPQLPPLLTQADISEHTWTLMLDIYNLGVASRKPGVATLWRHLAHWPGLLALVYSGLAPLVRDGTVQRSTRQVLELARTEGARIAHHRPDTSSLPEEALDLIAEYAGKVHRMVTIGHGVARWLQELEGEP